MIIIKPTTHELDPNKIKDPYTTRLFFKDPPHADFYLKGAIAWASTVINDKTEKSYPGFALMAGMLLDRNKEIRIFEEQEFTTIDNRLQSDGNIMMWPEDGRPWYGLAEFANKCYKKYGCRTYFYDKCQGDVYQLYMTQMQESIKENRLQQPIDPMELLHVNETGDLLIEKYIAEDRLKIDSNSKLNNMMRSVDKHENNGVHAIKCLLAGYEYIPWIDLDMMQRMGYGG